LVLLQTGKLHAAQQEFLSAVHLKPQYAEAHFNLALTLQQEGNLTESHNEFDKAYEINPVLRNEPHP
jgi:Tfp pilus assembly protein PilF